MNNKEDYYIISPNDQSMHEEILDILAHKDVQMKTMLGFHLTLLRMTTKKTENNKYWLVLGVGRNAHTLLVGM
jgi:hypothetical protein